MFVPEGYVSLGGALEYVARMREPEAVATLTPDGFAFFASVDAALRPRVARPTAPIRSIRAGPSDGPVRDLRPADPPMPAATAEPSPEAKAEMEARLMRWGEARRKLTAARDNARADLRQALISGTVRAVAVREDGNLVTMQPAGWRVTFERPRIAGLEPFAEAVAGRTVPVAATASGIPSAWGRAIIARADLARWCGAPPEAEPAERPTDWPAPAPSPQSVLPIGAAAVQASFPVAPALSDLPEWWTLTQASVWIALRDTAAVRDAGPPHHGRETRGVVGWHLDWAWRKGEGAEVGPDPAAADELLAAAARRGAIRGRGVPHTSHDRRELASDDWALATIAEDQRERGAKYLRPARGDGVHWRGVLVARDDVVREWPPFDVVEREPAQPAPAVPPPTARAATAESLPARSQPGQAYSRDALAAWFLLRVKTWPEGEPPPREADCIAAAQSFFADAPGRDVIRRIRQTKTPGNWRKRGPRPRR